MFARPLYWESATSALSKADKVMAKLSSQFRHESIQSRGDPFFTLARSIVGQQISVKAAEAVWNNLSAAVPDLSPEILKDMDDEALRSCGLSRQKVQYIKSIAAHFHENQIGAGYFDRKSDEQVIQELVAIKGVGRWTAEMFLMFYLLRPDILPLDDIGLQRGIERLYNGGERLPKSAMIDIALPWQPWRSVATWLIWRAIDPVPLEY